MEEKHSSDIVELQTRINEATKSLEKGHRKALTEVRTLKEKTNALELSISEKGSGGTIEDLNELNSAIEKLNRLTDSLISESTNAWKKYEKFEQECKMLPYKPAEMNELKVICKEKEELAKDLLCYSLGHFKRKSK
jgi:hypothetical protein